MRRICVVITARPSYSRVKSVLTALKARPDVELLIVAAGAAVVWRYGEVVKQIRADGFTVNAEIPCVVEGNQGRESVLSTGLLIAQLGSQLDNWFPKQHAYKGMVVTIADRHETLATAIAASYQNIPLCHIQGGEVSGSIDDKVRNAVTQLADIHCVATKGAEINVFDMLSTPAEHPTVHVTGYPTVHVTGCPGIDLAAEAVKLGPLPGHDVVVLQHPNTDESRDAADQIRLTACALRGMDALWFWPGEDAGAEAMSKEMRHAGLKPVRNLPPLDFLRTLLGSGVLVGNSSVGIRECSFLGVPVVNVGTRQRGRERGPNVVDVDYDEKAIRCAVYAWAKQQCPSVHTYGDGRAGQRIADILAGEAPKPKPKCECGLDPFWTAPEQHKEGCSREVAA